MDPRPVNARTGQVPTRLPGSRVSRKLRDSRRVTNHPETILCHCRSLSQTDPEPSVVDNADSGPGLVQFLGLRVGRNPWLSARVKSLMTGDFQGTVPQKLDRKRAFLRRGSNCVVPLLAL